MHLAHNSELVKLADPTPKGVGTVYSRSFDRLWHNNPSGAVMIFTSYGAPASGNVIRGQHSDDDGKADPWADIPGALVAPSEPTPTQWVDCLHAKRYVRLAAERGTASTLDGVWALAYRHARQPIGHANDIPGVIAGAIA
jgi:hypothetical protein